MSRPVKEGGPLHTIGHGGSKDVRDAWAGHDVNGFAFASASDRVQDRWDVSCCWLRICVRITIRFLAHCNLQFNFQLIFPEMCWQEVVIGVLKDIWNVHVKSSTRIGTRLDVSLTIYSAPLEVNKSLLCVRPRLWAAALLYLEIFATIKLSWLKYGKVNYYLLSLSPYNSSQPNVIYFSL
jgi:hypothetical protein